ncbi:MAG: hypothetical protein PF483_11560 [Halothiobacillus sp.]|jgi:hypothetical protein|nr:hypothetical protein [Halothiobacillus sp.]
MLETDSPITEEAVPNKYVAFCDVLGFSHAVERNFDATIHLYREFKDRIAEWPFPEKANISVYSDSILVVCDELPPLLYAIQSLWFATLAQDWLIRGGIAYGKYWEDRSNGNLFVVSDALVRAVRIESTVKVPGVALSPEVEVPLSAWFARFRDGPFSAPLLHFDGLNIVNPFNPYWFASARMRVSQLLDQFPQHAAKYEWFLKLSKHVENHEPLVPPAALEQMLADGVIEKCENNGDEDNAPSHDHKIA